MASFSLQFHSHHTQRLPRSLSTIWCYVARYASTHLLVSTQCSCMPDLISVSDADALVALSSNADLPLIKFPRCSCLLAIIGDSDEVVPVEFASKYALLITFQRGCCWHDQPIIVARRSVMQMQAMTRDVCNLYFCSKVVDFVSWRLEWQARGLPHMHVLIILLSPQIAARRQKLYCWTRTIRALC